MMIQEYWKHPDALWRNRATRRAEIVQTLDGKSVREDVWIAEDGSNPDLGVVCNLPFWIYGPTLGDTVLLKNGTVERIIEHGGRACLRIITMNGTQGERETVERFLIPEHASGSEWLNNQLGCFDIPPMRVTEKLYTLVKRMSIELGTTYEFNSYEVDCDPKF